MPAQPLIAEVVVTPMEAKPGEPILVDVRGPDGNSYANAETPFVRINGVTGSQQYLQFLRPGEQSILVSAMEGETVEQKRVVVRIVAPAEPAAAQAAQPGGPQMLSLSRSARSKVPMLHAASFHGETTQVAFSVGGEAPFQFGLSLDRPNVQRSGGDNAGIPSTITRVARETSARLTGRAATSPTLASLRGRSAVLNVPMRQVSVLGGKIKRIPQDAQLIHTRGGKIAGHIRIAPAVKAESIMLPPALQPLKQTVYKWDFGDGKTFESHSMRVDHDYRESLDNKREHQQFHVTLSIEPPDGSRTEAKRTLTIFNAYAICKKHGVLAPFTRQNLFAQREGFSFTARMVVENVEDYPLILTHRRLRVIGADTDDLSPLGPMEAVTPPIEVPANGQREIPLTVPFTLVPHDSTSFTMFFFGQAPDGKAIRVEGTFDVPARDRMSDAVVVGGIAVSKIAGMSSIINSAISSGQALQVTAPASGASSSSIQTLRPIGRISQSVLGRNLNRTAVNAAVLGQNAGRLNRVVDTIYHREPPTLMHQTIAAAPVVGEICNPENLPDLSQQQLDEGWTCQATPEVREVETPARFLNALKGDIILSPGGNGLIGGLLRQVTPAQRYSHSGIMTRNFDQITHSTACEDRLMDYPNGSILGKPAPSDGFMPNVLKYQWPGVITQTVEEAIFGEDMVDPDNGKTYKVGGFSPMPEGAEINRAWEIIPPFVVKPDPLLETPEIRTKLRQVANDALAQTGNSHYRFYCYTDPTIGQKPEGIAPASAGWAAGTYPSVCSSFIWMCLKRQGAMLESRSTVVASTDLESDDLDVGAEVGSATPDGLYRYTAEERLDAAKWLKEALVAKVMKQIDEDAGPLSGPIDFFTDIVDDVSNQVINTFESDWADTDAKDSERWHETEAADAVSPDNLMRYDSPAALGLYGMAVPVSYRTRRLEEVVIHRWKKVPTKGKLHGRVMYSGTPVLGAYVQLYDGKTDFTDAAGNYEIPAIPFGPYQVKAFKDNINGFPAEAVPIALELSQPDQVLDIELQPPKDYYRRVQVTVVIATKDDEWGDDEHARTTHFREVFLGPWHSHEEVYFEQRMGGEVRIEFRAVLDINMDRSISVRTNAKLFEGTSESTNDLDDEENGAYMAVPKDSVRAGSIHLYNDEFDGGDSSDLTFTVTNLVQP